MSVSTQIIIVHCEGCPEVEIFDCEEIKSAPLPTITAKGFPDGWMRVGGKDFCPACVKKLELAEPPFVPTA